MSTKTTFKRVALVAVAALGLGVLTSVAPANAAAGTFTIDTSSVTVVGTNASGTALFKITVGDNVDGTGTGLAADETITATIVGVPTGTGTPKTLATNGVFGTNAALGTVAADLNAVSLKAPTTRTGAYVAQTPNGIAAQAFGGVIGSASTAQTDSASTATNSVYYLGVQNNISATTGTNAAIDQGAYTIRIRLTQGSFVLKEQNVTVKFVSSAADSGAAFTIAQTGSKYKSRIDTYTATNNTKVTLTNGTTGGRLVESSATLYQIVAPSPAVALITTSTGGVINTKTSPGDAEGLVISDTGVNGEDGAFTSTTTASKDADKGINDGVYGVYSNAATTYDTVSVTTPTSLRVRYGATEAISAITFAGAATATAAGTTAYVTASGMSVLNTSGTLAAQRSFVVPLTNKSVTYTLLATNGSTAVADYPLIFTVTWSGNQAVSDVSPVSGSTGKQTVRTDANGKASITLTNANPQDGAVATIGVTGFANDTQAIAQTITWNKSKVTTVSISPAAYTAALGSANTLTITVTDQFRARMAGVVLQPSFSATTDANYVAAPATITTGADGTVAFTWTDKGVAGSDTITFTAVSDTTKSQSVKVTYSATAATVASFKTYYSHAEGDSTSSTLVPSTGVYVGTSTDLLITQARNNSLPISKTAGPTATNDLVFYYVQALTSTGAAAGSVPVTITAPSGAFVLGSSDLRSSSTVKIADANGFLSFVGGSNKTGAITFTITAGTVSTTVSQWVGNAAADGRFVTLTGPATGVANGEPNLYTGTVTDRHGNVVSGVSVTVNAAGASSLGGGSTSATYVTLADGKFTFTGTSFVSAGGAGTFTATATTAGDYSSSAGYVGTTEVDSTLLAGNKTATTSVTWSAGNSAAADNAQAATDAAAEATDAANAATDAANAAAEAADAATAAAQDAADAVAALSTQVSEMVNALKKQITALTNLVIKIQKKVKA